MQKAIMAVVLAIVAFVSAASAAPAAPAASPMQSVAIEPRSLTWNIVSDREMSRICVNHGLRANCEGMAAWDGNLRQCIIWTRSPRGADDMARWQVLHHELQHCQEGHFHNSGL